MVVKFVGRGRNHGCLKGEKKIITPQIWKKPPMGEEVGAPFRRVMEEGLTYSNINGKGEGSHTYWMTAYVAKRGGRRHNLCEHRETNAVQTGA